MEKGNQKQLGSENDRTEDHSQSIPVVVLRNTVASASNSMVVLRNTDSRRLVDQGWCEGPLAGTGPLVGFPYRHDSTRRCPLIGAFPGKKSDHYPVTLPSPKAVGTTGRSHSSEGESGTPCVAQPHRRIPWGEWATTVRSLPRQLGSGAPRHRAQSWNLHTHHTGNLVITAP